MKKALPPAVTAGAWTAAIEFPKIGSGGGTKVTDPWCTPAGSTIVRTAAPPPGRPPPPPRTAMNLATGAGVGVGAGEAVVALGFVAQGSTPVQFEDASKGAGEPQPARSAASPASDIASEKPDRRDLRMRDLPEALADAAETPASHASYANDAMGSTWPSFDGRPPSPRTEVRGVRGTRGDSEFCRSRRSGELPSGELERRKRLRS